MTPSAVARRAARIAEAAAAAFSASRATAAAASAAPPGKQERPRCAHVGPPSRAQCIRHGHKGDNHRY